MALFSENDLKIKMNTFFKNVTNKIRNAWYICRWLIKKQKGRAVLLIIYSSEPCQPVLINDIMIQSEVNIRFIAFPYSYILMQPLTNAVAFT